MPRSSIAGTDVPGRLPAPDRDRDVATHLGLLPIWGIGPWDLVLLTLALGGRVKASTPSTRASTTLHHTEIR